MRCDSALARIPQFAEQNSIENSWRWRESTAHFCTMSQACSIENYAIVWVYRLTTRFFVVVFRGPFRVSGPFRVESNQIKSNRRIIGKEGPLRTPTLRTTEPARDTGKSRGNMK